MDFPSRQFYSHLLNVLFDPSLTSTNSAQLENGLFAPPNEVIFDI